MRVSPPRSHVTHAAHAAHAAADAAPVRASDAEAALCVRHSKLPNDPPRFRKLSPDEVREQYPDTFDAAKFRKSGATMYESLDNQQANVNRKKIVAFPDANPWSPRSVWANVKQAFGHTPSSLKAAASVGEMVRGKASVTFTGHGQGGGKATLAAAVANRPSMFVDEAAMLGRPPPNLRASDVAVLQNPNHDVVTFNTSKVHPNTFERYHVDSEAQNHQRNLVHERAPRLERYFGNVVEVPAEPMGGGRLGGHGLNDIIRSILTRG